MSGWAKIPGGLPPASHHEGPKFNSRTMHVNVWRGKMLWFRIFSPQSNFPLNHFNDAPSSSLEAPPVKQDQSANMISKPASSE